MSSPTVWSAGRYEFLAQHIASIAAQVVDAADRRAPIAGAALVDLACGTGSAALAAAGRGARVTGVDITPELIAIAAQKAAAADLSVSWVTADAAATGLPARSYDTVVSNMGIIYVEPTAQVAEFERLLKPGATLAFSSWVHDADNPFWNPIVEVLGVPPAAAYSPHQWSERETIAARLSNGFADVDIETGMHTWQFASVDTIVKFLMTESPTHLSMLEQVDESTREELRAAFEAAMRARSDNTGVHFDSPYVVVTARRR